MQPRDLSLILAGAFRTGNRPHAAPTDIRISTCAKAAQRARKLRALSLDPEHAASVAVENKFRLGRLVLRIISAARLLAADSHGTSDPFVDIFVSNKKKGKQVRKTGVQQCTRNPMWDEEFSFDVWNSSDKIELKVFDFDLGAGVHDFLGCRCIALKDFFVKVKEEGKDLGQSGFEMVEDYALEGANGTEFVDAKCTLRVQGTIKVAISYQPVARPTKPARLLKVPRGNVQQGMAHSPRRLVAKITNPMPPPMRASWPQSSQASAPSHALTEQLASPRKLPSLAGKKPALPPHLETVLPETVPEHRLEVDRPCGERTPDESQQDGRHGSDSADLASGSVQKEEDAEATVGSSEEGAGLGIESHSLLQQPDTSEVQESPWAALPSVVTWHLCLQIPGIQSQWATLPSVVTWNLAGQLSVSMPMCPAGESHRTTFEKEEKEATNKLSPLEMPPAQLCAADELSTADVLGDTDAKAREAGSDVSSSSSDEEEIFGARKKRGGLIEGR